jgi:hypothetical protein
VRQASWCDPAGGPSKGQRFALIDFGMVGRLSPARRSQLVNLLAG